MESKGDLNRYVIHWHYDLMTNVEKRAKWHLFDTMQATRGRSDIAAQQEARNIKTPSSLLSDDPEVLRLAREGYDAFVERTAARILADCGEKLVLNRCLKCGGLARTPTAKQCRFCGNDWHERQVNPVITSNPRQAAYGHISSVGMKRDGRARMIGYAIVAVLVLMMLIWFAMTHEETAHLSKPAGCPAFGPLLA